MKLSYYKQIYLIFTLLVGISLIAILVNYAYFVEDSKTNVRYGANFKVKYLAGETIKNSHEQYIKNASEFWSEILNEDLVLDIQVSMIDEQNNILAKGGPFDSNNLRSGGIIYFNKNARSSNWTDVTKHEIGHILGIGTNNKWRNAIITVDDKKYLNSAVFPRTYMIYRQEYSGTLGYIPLNSNGSHFSEEIFDTELMTPYAELPNVRQPVTNLTLNALKELGWRVNMDKAEEKNIQ